MTESSIIRYGTFSEDVLDQQSQQVADLSGNVFIKPEVGENVFRFLPPPMGRNSPFRVTAMHYVKNVPGLDKVLVFACPRHELKVQCLACQKAEELSRSTNSLDRERGKKLQAGLSVYGCVVNRKSPEPVVRVLKFGKSIWDALRAIRKSPRLGGDYTDPTDRGFDIVITRVGTGENDTEYTVNPDRNSSVLHPDPAVVQMLIDSQPDLDSLVDATVPEPLRAAWAALDMSPQRGPVPGPGFTGQSNFTPPQRWAPPALSTATAPAMPPPQQRIVETVGRAVHDAQQVIEYDADFNPIMRQP